MLALLLGSLFSSIVADMPTSSSRPMTQSCNGKSFSTQIVPIKVLGPMLHCLGWIAIQLPLECQSLNLLQAVGRERVLVSHSLTSGAVGGVIPPKPDGLRMRKGWLTTGDSGEGEAGTGLAEMQPALGPGTRLQPVDRIGHCALAMAEWSYRYLGPPQTSELRSGLVVGEGRGH